MTRFTKKVTVLSITSFVRLNMHIPAYPNGLAENFVAITMQTNEGLYVNYTREDTAFAKQVSEGDSFMLSGQLVEQRNDEYGPHWKVSHCKRGHFKSNKLDKKREARKQARLEKLGLA